MKKGTSAQDSWESKLPTQREAFEGDPAATVALCSNGLCYLNAKGVCEADKNMDLLSSLLTFRDVCKARKQAHAHFKRVSAVDNLVRDLRTKWGKES